MAVTVWFVLNLPLVSGFTVAGFKRSLSCGVELIQTGLGFQGFFTGSSKGYLLRALEFTWRGRGLSKLVISRVIIGVTPFRVLITPLISYLLSPLPLQAGCRISWVLGL